ncbi:MAG TPA: ATP-binding protein [Myxococcota bacterium]|nr:ATP-binding protein [Myxococcota bacterium]
MGDVRRRAESSAFLEWAHGLDARWLASAWSRGWIVATGFAVALAVVLSSGPRMRATFGLDLAPLLALMAFTLAYALGVVELHRRFGLPAHARGLAYCAAVFFHAFTAGSAVTLSREPGSFALGAIPIAIAWWHVSMFNGSREAPFVPLADAAGLLAALALRPEPGPAVVLAVATVLGPGFGLALGSFLVGARKNLAFVDDQREAIAAQALAAAALERERSATSLETALADEQDARAALADALRVVEHLRADAAHGAVAADAELRDELDGLFAALSRVARSLGSHAAGEAAAVAVAPELQAAVDDARGRWPQIAVELDGVAEQNLPRARVVGGREALRHLLDNLIANACEGDGTRLPTRVEVALTLREGRVDVRIRDDGPGFREAALASPVEPFASSKPSGTGLGLFLVERVVRASGGELRRRNLASGGAEATASLPQAARGDAEREGPAA